MGFNSGFKGLNRKSGLLTLLVAHLFLVLLPYGSVPLTQIISVSFIRASWYPAYVDHIPYLRLYTCETFETACMKECEST